MTEPAIDLREVARVVSSMRHLERATVAVSWPDGADPFESQEVGWDSLPRELIAKGVLERAGKKRFMLNQGQYLVRDVYTLTALGRAVRAVVLARLACRNA